MKLIKEIHKKDRAIRFRISTEMFNRIKAQTTKRNVKIAHFVREVLCQWMDEDEK